MIPVAGRTDREKQFYAMWADLLDILRQYNGETHQDDNTCDYYGRIDRFLDEWHVECGEEDMDGFGDWGTMDDVWRALEAMVDDGVC